MKQKTFALLLLLIAFSNANANWGLDSGRANLTDGQDLISDYIKLVKARGRIEEASKLGLLEERQRALIAGGSDTKRVVNILEKLSEILLNEVVLPSREIARNPAASCGEAQIPMTELLEVSRTAQLFGIQENLFTKYREEFQELINTRCRQEALDECNLTGRFVQILERAALENRNDQLLNGSQGKDDINSWALGALKECANYELVYTSTSTIKEQFTIDSKITGRLYLKPDESATSYLDVKINGHTSGGENPFLQNVKCVGDKTTRMSCAPGGGAIMAAVAEIGKMDLVHTTYYTDVKDLSGWDQANGAMQKSKKEGKTIFEFVFGPAIMLVPSTIEYIGSNTEGSGPKMGPMNVPVEVGATAFSKAYEAFKSGKRGEIEGQARFNFSTDLMGVYPTVFEFEVSKKNGDATDTTKFELIHTPNKKPFPPRQGEGPKKRPPLKPKRPERQRP